MTTGNEEKNFNDNFISILILSEKLIPQYVIPNKSVQYLQIEVFIFTIVYLL
jgi:hypothetical protein